MSTTLRNTPVRPTERFQAQLFYQTTKGVRAAGETGLARVERIVDAALLAEEHSPIYHRDGDEASATWLQQVRQAALERVKWEEV